MPQVFGADQLDLIKQSSCFRTSAESGPREDKIERATNPTVAAEARMRGLVPLRMGKDPIWHHPASGMIVSLTPAHNGENAAYTSTANLMAKLKRQFPTDEERARASRTPEEIEQEQNAAAAQTRSKKQQAVDAAKRRKEQDALILFRKLHAPFRNQGEVDKAFSARRTIRPGDTVAEFGARLRDLTPADRQEVHKAVFPERYRQ